MSNPSLARGRSCDPLSAIKHVVIIMELHANNISEEGGLHYCEQMRDESGQMFLNSDACPPTLKQEELTLLVPW